jgi:hypothetical protein
MYYKKIQVFNELLLQLNVDVNRFWSVNYNMKGIPLIIYYPINIEPPNIVNWMQYMPNLIPSRLCVNKLHFQWDSINNISYINNVYMLEEKKRTSEI